MAFQMIGNNDLRGQGIEHLEAQDYASYAAMSCLWGERRNADSSEDYAGHIQGVGQQNCAGVPLLKGPRLHHS